MLIIHARFIRYRHIYIYRYIHVVYFAILLGKGGVIFTSAVSDSILNGVCPEMGVGSH